MRNPTRPPTQSVRSPVRPTFLASLLFAGASSLLLPDRLFAQDQPDRPPEQQVGSPASSTPRELSKIRAEFGRVRDRMAAVQREFDRAARNDLPEVRDAALKDWQRALDGVEPYAKQLSADVPEEKVLLDEYNGWLARYAEAAGFGNAGDFFLQISRHWSDLSAGTEGWDQENQPATFDAVVKTDANDENAAAVRALGMPKTVAFVNAADKYLADVTARPDYLRYKGAQNVKDDLTRVEQLRDQATSKLAKAIDAIVDDAGNAKLDQAGRDRFERMIEADVPAALGGSPQQAQLQTRGRAILYAYDKQTLGEQAAADKAMIRLTTAAERDWPRILTRYATIPDAPVGATRGQIVKITGIQNRAGKDFGDGQYDFAGFVGNGAPVVGNYTPEIKEYLKTVLAQTNLKTLPDVDYEIVAIVRGTAQVPGVRRPGATTAPAAADDASATTAPATTDCTVLDIVAVKAGPLCIGTKVTVTPQG